jgi:hypothetical protein
VLRVHRSPTRGRPCPLRTPPPWVTQVSYLLLAFLQAFLDKIAWRWLSVMWMTTLLRARATALAASELVTFLTVASISPVVMP